MTYLVTQSEIAFPNANPLLSRSENDLERECFSEPPHTPRHLGSLLEESHNDEATLHSEVKQTSGLHVFINQDPSGKTSVQQSIDTQEVANFDN